MTGLGATNRNVQQLKKLLGRRSERHATRQFVIEGPVLSTEAVRAGWICLAQYVPEGSGVKVEGAGPVNELAAGVLERVASTQSPQAPLTLAKMRDHDVVAVLAAASFIVVLDRVGDPGNVGTILRSAEAAGAEAIVLTPGSVDVFNPKVLRSSAGAVFHVPVLVATLEEVADSGFELAGTSSHEFPDRTVVAHTEADLTRRLAIVMGNEAAGLPDEWNDHDGPIDTWLTIRHRGRSESLNVAMAATIIVFEAARQRAEYQPGSDPG
ncbi:TrmH family RNA methyltransferase [Ilumatobacter nonamiensis]|uniref:TrmH family RNA methyltransferase n=1 Tax=Ilumatobacter nonamiensis TaxID=467093 RepID=UPI00130DE110|nr:RNA methyltransferase [Ilumatobacter nonamiensis]